MDGKYIQLLLTITIPVFLIVSAVLYASIDSNFYYNEIEKGVSDANFVNQAEANEIASQVVLFFKDKGELSEDLVGIQAKTHMNDVKNIRDITKYLLYFSSVLIIISVVTLFIIKKQSRIAKSLVHGSIIILLINIFIFAASKFFFNVFWTKFHELIFSNDLWRLNPSTDALVAVFTNQFFIDLIARIVIITSSIAVILLVTGIFFHQFVWKEFPKNMAKLDQHQINKEDSSKIKEDFQW